MNAAKVYSLCEALVDITQIATASNFKMEDSRAMVAEYIAWAQEFEDMHQHIQWGIDSPCDYMEAIEYFSVYKMQCYGHRLQSTE